MTKNLRKFLLFVFVIAFYQFASHNLVLASSINNPQVTSSSAVALTQTKVSNTSNTPQNTTNSTVTSSSTLSTESVTSSNSIKEITSVSNVNIDKKWTITLSQPVDISSAKNSIKVIDKKTNKEVPVDISTSGQGLYLIVSVIGNYNPDSDYQLFISNNLVSKYNKRLPQAVNMNFKTGSVISSIDDLSVSVNQFDDYTLPQTLTATMSNGQKKQVSVTWDKIPDTSASVGTYVYHGTVENYSRSVTLTFTLNPFKPVASISNSYRSQSNLQVNLYNYLMNEDNRQYIAARAIELHGGDTSNNCVYFASEALRKAGLTSLPEYISNTIELTQQLLSYGWSICYDLSKLLPGDICFTTSYGNGPTHTYTFMNWISPNSYDYGYVCDNQGDEYSGSPFHTRNIDFATEAKDALSYFMYLP